MTKDRLKKYFDIVRPLWQGEVMVVKDEVWQRGNYQPSITVNFFTDCVRFNGYTLHRVEIEKAAVFYGWI